jgi:undecaprenyl diphosphate synthase
MTLQLAISYGGQEEIVDTVRRLSERVARGEIRPGDIDEKSFGEALPSVQTGPVDLLIRTGGEYRISNFLLWGSAYAEFVFSQTLWPDFGETDLYQAIESFQSRQRRYGRVPVAGDEEGEDEEGRPAERSSTPAQV